MGRSKLGQHFLMNRHIAMREISYASITKDDVVLEIGPGRGMLTELLARQAKQVIAVEIDQHLASQLPSLLPANVTVICEDVLALDFHTLPPFSKIVANLPFQISSPLTFKLLDYPFKQAVMIYQEDFAQRMVASPNTKEYSRLTVILAYKSRCRILEHVPKTNFSPIPKVDASIVEIVPHQTPPFAITNESFFFTLTKQLFTHRRKQIKTTLSMVYEDIDGLPFIQQRVEELTPQQIAQLANDIYQRIEQF